MRQLPVLVLVACSSGGGTVDGPNGQTPDALGTFPNRPFVVKVPEGVPASSPAPLVLALHGYADSGVGLDGYWSLTQTANAEGFYLVTPDGSIDSYNSRFWNATDACCNFFDSTVDDVGYINYIIENVKMRYAIDPKRIYVMGHSNGGFMSNRVACELADKVAAIVTLAGVTYADANKCQPSAPIAVLHVHGELDNVIKYAGGVIFQEAPYPGAVANVSTWASKNGCDATPLAAGKLELVNEGIADETDVSRYQNCDANGTVELWRQQGGSHIPTFNAAWAPAIFDFLKAHPKP